MLGNFAKSNSRENLGVQTEHTHTHARLQTPGSPSPPSVLPFGTLCFSILAFGSSTGRGWHWQHYSIPSLYPQEFVVKVDWIIYFFLGSNFKEWGWFQLGANPRPSSSEFSRACCTLIRDLSTTRKCNWRISTLRLSRLGRPMKSSCIWTLSESGFTHPPRALSFLNLSAVWWM